MKSKHLIIFLAFFAQMALSQSSLPHNPGLFIGAKYLKQSNSIAPVLGLNYEYRLPNSKIATGIGLNSEFKFDEQIGIQFGPAFYIHPIDQFSLLMSPSVLFINYGEYSNTDNLSYIEINERTGRQTKFVL
ncbi:hypothetical protein OAQ99_05580, partial [Candidatus Kapabacteria bacterium]|nr:hypothetical protein [Candidatus Kapabacteria bacterium]